MGLRSAATCCQRSTMAVGFIFQQERDRDLIVYLDDFNGVVPKSLEAALKDFEAWVFCYQTLVWKSPWIKLYLLQLHV